MKFVIITHTPHYRAGDNYLAYAPYIREMNIWLKYVDEVVVVAPFSTETTSAIHGSYKGKKLNLKAIPRFSVTSFTEVIRTAVLFPFIFVKIFLAMRTADHIHLRCPGNTGLIGCLAQVFFPKKQKTAKYAGNWDPNAKQPLSYRFQKWLLSNAFLTKNMKVLVYGDWPGQSSNVKSFFTATYPRSAVEKSEQRTFEPPYRFVFVGGLTVGKRPEYALKLVDALRAKGDSCIIEFFGDGPKFFELEAMLGEGDKDMDRLHGNTSAETVEKRLRQSHFLILPSRSEGWPKAVAEAMFWGVIPMATSVSCVPWMLDHGKRGVLLTMDLERDAQAINSLLKQAERMKEMSSAAMTWSQQYTLDDFEYEIKKLLDEGSSIN